MDNIHERWAYFFLCFKCTVGFAVIQVILSVFIQQTFMIASMDAEIMIRDKEVTGKAICDNLGRLFEELDKSGNGRLDKDEFETVLHIPKVKLWFSALGVDVEEANELFLLLNDEEGFVTREDFIAGVKSFRGPAKNKDIFTLKQDVRKVQDAFTH